MTQYSPPAPGNQESGASVEEFGYKQAMTRGTGRFASFAVAFAFVSIATGIFTTYGSVLNTSGPAGIWTWPIVIIGQLAVAFIFGSLAARIPVTGYSYQWMSRLANPVLGWIIGWVSFSFLAVVVVAVDYTIASTVMPVLLGYEGTALNAWVITGVVIMCQALLVGFSTKWTERVNNFAVTAELIGMIALVLLLLIVGFVAKEVNFANLFSTGAIPSEGYLSIGTLTSAGPWMLGFLLGAFTIVGFESAANLAEETKDPARVVPRAMWQAVLASGVLGFLFLVAVTLLAGDPVELAKSGTPVADVISRSLGPIVGTGLLVLVVIAIFACGMVILMTGVRLVWAMSRDQRFPGWQGLHKVSPRFGTPLNATVFMFVIGELILAVFSTRTDALFGLFAAATLLPAIIYTGTVVMYVVKRKSLPPSKGFDLGRWEIPVIVVALIWLAFELLLFRDASFVEPWIYVLIMLAIGAVYFAYLLLTKGTKGLVMPDMHSIDAELTTDATDAAKGRRTEGTHRR
ncbi:amino acid permease [Streptosporangium sp. NBC_01755]|uniref:amino acid permease n=1 Tax=unclassified Streptosporangium TaxID=2632669 RepID=UPI002DD84229|nr:MULTISPECIES: amino acid permease [unclassified Streptosporangium]WSA26725.1 amino acid permease [Streptosporangium sp. NBC_01810]WSD01850.1 amino acid permease [Streptosporangium sp. NBC_01755]